jgi:hypothetical protein
VTGLLQSAINRLGWYSQALDQSDERLQAAKTTQRGLTERLQFVTLERNRIEGVALRGGAQRRHWD